MNPDRRNRTELLAPAGSYEILKAVVRAGADAAYAAGTKFGARAYADNFTTEEFVDAVGYMHLHGKKLYLALNTLLRERELSEEIYDYVRPFYEAGVDGVIVQDLGVLRVIREQFPGLPIHASTQMTVTGAYGAKLLAEAGCTRIVTARELSLEEIADIYEKTGLEIESFVHGALCYCYSGQCLLSSMIGGRSGNRGRCAQPCRLPYERAGGSGLVGTVSRGQYLLSPKDLCAVELIPKLIQSGVHSFKIEGRMKQAGYAAGVTSIYRRYIDWYEEYPNEVYQADPSDLQKLEELGSRCGFTKGYYLKHNGPDMITFTNPSHEKKRELCPKLNGEAHREQDAKVKIKGILILSKENPAKLVLQCKDVQVEVTGDLVQPAQSQPLKIENALEKIGQTGDSPFEFEELQAELEPDIFYPAGALKKLRRSGLEALKEKLLSVYHRASPRKTAGQRKDICLGPGKKADQRMQLRVLVETMEQFQVALAFPQAERIYAETFLFERGGSFAEEIGRAAGLLHKAGKACYLALPYLFRKETADWYRSHWEDIHSAGVDGYLARNLEELSFLKEHGIEPGQIQGDYGLYCWSRQAAEELCSLGAGGWTLPVEQNSRQLQELDRTASELIIYGRQPLMLSAQCLQKNTEGCTRKSGVCQLRDRFGKNFPVRNRCEDCYNILYNTSPLSLFHQAKEVKKLSPEAVRISFTMENRKDTEKALEYYAQSFQNGEKLPQEQYWKDFTNGHFKRGAD